MSVSIMEALLMILNLIILEEVQVITVLPMVGFVGIVAMLALSEQRGTTSGATSRKTLSGNFYVNHGGVDGII